MRVLAIALVCLLSATFAPAQQGSAEDQIKKYEQDWTQGIVRDKAGAALIEKNEADDIITINADGSVTNKSQDKELYTSGDIKVQSMELTDLKVRAYGDTAVAIGTNAIDGTFKGKEMKGNYRFTDVWVKRNGKWQVVASQVTKVE
jgi:ketosteroid isomerase-like protein